MVFFRFYLVLSVCLLSFCLYSNPSCPDVIKGMAQFTQEGQQLTIKTQTDKTIINWDQFSVNANEITHFLQPHKHAATLNRVLSAVPSEILGSLSSNGVLFLINPNGIVVGPGGQIDVNGLVASTLDVSNGAVLRGDDLLFSGDSKAAVENYGLIQGGDDGVYLIGRHLVNQGDVLAVSSEVHFGAGSRILLKTQDKHIYIQPDLESSSEGIGVDHAGTIEAGHVEIHSDGNLYELAVRHTGKIQAVATTEREGEIYLVAFGGETRVEEGGTLLADKRIEVLGTHVALLDYEKLDTKESGTIVVGGLPERGLNATHTVIGSDVVIDSNLSEVGDGGNVTVFGTDTAAYFGNIRAMGGSKAGNGGTVEVSGYNNLVFRGLVNTEASNGKNGLLILDPTNITISGAATTGGTFSGLSPTDTFSLAFTGAAATLNSGDLNTALQSNDVLVTTASAFGAAGDITISGTTNLNLLTTSHTLTLRADNNINLNSPLTMIDSAGGTSVLNMNALGTGAINLNSSITGSNLDSINLTTASGTIDLDNAINASGITVNITSGGALTSTGGGTNTLTAGQCTISAATGITITNDITFTGNGASSNLSMTAGTVFTHNQVMRFNNWGTATASSVTGNFLVDNQVTCTGTDTLIFNGGVDLISQGGTNLFNDLSGQNTDLFLNANQDITINSQIDINNFNSATLTATRDFVLNQDFEPDQTTTVSVVAGRDILHTGAAADIIANNGTTLSFTAGNDFRSDEPFTANNFTNVNITATAGDVTILVGGTTNVPGANTTVTAGNDINLLTTFRNLTSGDISFNATNDVNIGPSTILAQVGTRNGTMTVNAGRDLNVVGGSGTNDRSQIGFNNALVDSDIDLTVGRDINVLAGGNSNSIAVIGHGFTAGTYRGDIIINSVGKDVNITGDPGVAGSTKFAHIGHSRFTSGISSFTGDIRGTAVGSPASISGVLRLTGGNDTTCFSLFGHGGRDSNALETYSGNIRVHANEIVLDGGTSTDCFANIGFFAVAQTGGVNPVIIAPTSSVEVISDTTISMTAMNNGIVSIGGRVLNTAAHLSSMDLSSVSIRTGGDLTMTSGTGVETDATIGAFSNFGTSDTNLTMNIGGDLLINAGTGAVVQIVNGSGTIASKNTTIQVAGNIKPSVSGGFSAFIENPTGNLDVIAQGVITLSASTRISNVGASGGELNVTGGEVLAFSGGAITNSGAGISSVNTTTGDLTISSTSSATSVGNLSVNSTRDIVCFDGALVSSSGGTVSVAAARDIALTGAGTGSATISSAGNGIYTAGRDVYLRGVSAVNEGVIENTTGVLQVIAGECIEVNAFGRVENLGTGSLTLVVDNNFPVPPMIGPGAFSLSALGTVSALGGGPVRIFTAVRDQNMIAGTGNLNGSTFTPGPFLVDSSTEQWRTYFPSGFGGSPFTIFYKEGIPSGGGTIPSVLDVLSRNPNAFVPLYELSFILEGYKQDPVFSWLYQLRVKNQWCEKGEEDPYCVPDFLNIKKLPPYTHRLDPIEF